MTTLTARVRQAPPEVRRYMLDYTAQLNAGELVNNVAAFVTPLQTPPLGATALTVTGIVIAPLGNQAVFFVQGGTDGISYEIQFLGTTTLTQKFEDIVQVDVMEKM